VRFPEGAAGAGADVALAGCGAGAVVEISLVADVEAVGAAATAEEAVGTDSGAEVGAGEAGAAEVQEAARPAAAPAMPTLRKLRRDLDGMVVVFLLSPNQPTW